MATMKLSKCLLVVGVFALAGCATTETESDEYYADRKRSPSAEEAARALGCADDEVALCIQTNCELEEFQCVYREDARQMFRAGEFRHD